MVEMEMKGSCCNLVLVRGRSYVMLGVTILTGYNSRTSPTVLQTEMARLHPTSLSRKSSLKSLEEGIYIYIQTRIYIYIQTYIYLCVCLCVWVRICKIGRASCRERV